MTFGGWRGISFGDCCSHEIASPGPGNSKRKDLTQRAQREGAEVAETTCRYFVAGYLAEVGDFLVEVGESSFEGLAVVGMSGGGEVVHDTGS